jgi:dTDP-4-amino-4,6-dideoxygalactose transaminase
MVIGSSQKSRSLSNVIKRAELRQEERHNKRKDKRQNTYREEMAQVKQILAADGIEENDEVCHDVLVHLCRCGEGGRVS